MFLDVVIGYLGSMYDVWVFWNFELYRKVVNGNILREFVVNINGNDIWFLLFGDGVYFFFLWLLKFYFNNVVLNLI